MKKLKNQSGFGAVEIILVLFIVAILGFTGWYVLNSNNKKNNNASNSSTTVANVKPTYTLPVEWAEMTCNGGGLKANLAYPKNDKATNCDDRKNVVLIDFGNYPDIKCMTADEVTKAKEIKPLKDYTCKEITISGVKVTNSSADYGDGPMINYDYKQSPQLHITYYSNSAGKLVEASTLESIAQSVKF